uniref:Uncharacterized protein n=1 Tax=Klebsiella pneumoniae TaxID=573 RepID=A0A2P1BNY8_KLEPN|nr:hypothetical protein [Klebsiella pneumoniae]
MELLLAALLQCFGYYYGLSPCLVISYFVELPNAAQMGIAASVLVAFVAGLFMMLYIVNFRALYLSIPDTYRKQSALCQFIVGKAKFYCRVYLLTYVFNYLLYLSGLWGYILDGIIYLFLILFDANC